jgi:hypothetical protein
MYLNLASVIKQVAHSEDLSVPGSPEEVTRCDDDLQIPVLSVKKKKKIAFRMIIILKQALLCASVIDTRLLYLGA